MKVLLKEDVDNLGYTGEVLNVADGYGRNYLIPRGMAVKATPNVLKQAETWRDRAAVRLTELRKEHEALSDRINATQLEFTARAGEMGKLYGSITTNDIVEQLNETLGTEIDRKIVSGGPLRQLGEHKVPVRLSRDYNPQVTVFIHPFVEEEEVDEEAGTVEVPDEGDVPAEAEVVAEIDETEVEESDVEESVSENDEV